MSTPDPIWLTEQDVVELMSLGEAIDALETGLREAKAERAVNMGKTHASWGGGNTLHAIGAVLPALGYFGTKSWGHTHGGATPLFLLWDERTGGLLAIIEAFALGQMRTGGISGVATRWMSAADANGMAIIGTGKQALTQVAAIALVRPLSVIRIFSPNEANRTAFARKIQALDGGAQIVVASTVAEAVDGLPIVTTVTRAREAFLAGSMVADGAHINAVGAITPERRELAPDLLDRCVLAAADDTDAAIRLSAEFGPNGGRSSPLELQRLSDLVDGSGRAISGQGVSIFKAMGMGLSDLSLAVQLYERARARGAGRPFDHPRRAMPRLGASQAEGESAA